jgi:RNA polymerase sigma-70 factor (ECF subfamily)
VHAGSSGGGDGRICLRKTGCEQQVFLASANLGLVAGEQAANPPLSSAGFLGSECVTMPSDKQNAVDLIRRVADGDGRLADELFPLVYQRLHALAGDLLRRERSDHLLQPTALVHEAYLKLVDAKALDWRGRAHFAAIAARAMRQVLVDHARRQDAGKRGRGWQRITLSGLTAEARRDDEVTAIDQALARLAAVNARAARTVELTVFGDLTVAEIAAVLDVSERTASKDLTIGRAWLLRELDRMAG